MWVYLYIMDAPVQIALKNLSNHPLSKISRAAVLRTVNQHLKTMQFIAQKIEYSQKIIRFINNTIIPTAVGKATTTTHKDLIHTTIAPLTTSLQNNIRAFQAENIPDDDIPQLEFGLNECVNIIREAVANKEIPMHELPPNLLENLLKCQKSATQAIQILDLMVNSTMISSAKRSEKKKDATRVLNLYGPKKLNLPEKAKGWADYFKARREQELAQMKKVEEEEEVQHEREWAQMEQDAALHVDEMTEMAKEFPHGFPIFKDSIRNLQDMTGPQYKSLKGGRKTRKRKRRRKTRKRKLFWKTKRKKKTRKRKHKKRHHRTKRRK